MPITPPVADQEISASAWGIPVTNEVNRLTTLANVELTYAQITSPVNITAGSTSAANTIVSTVAVTYDGSPIIVEFFGLVGSPAYSGGQIGIDLWDGSSDLGYMFTMNSIGASTVTVPCLARRRIIPSAGSHTFSVRGWIYPAGQTGTVTAGTGVINAYAPAFIRVTKAL